MPNILEKANIIPNEKELVLSSGIIKLSIDKSYSKFITVDLYDFIEWIKYFEKSVIDQEDKENLVIEYSDTSVSLYPTHRPENPFTDEPFAVLQLKEHPKLTMLKAINDKKHGIDEFADILTYFKENMASADFVDLLGNLRDFRINKVTSIERTRDNKGNFAFICSRQRVSNGQDMGKSDFEPPESLRFRIPIFEGAKDAVDFAMDFHFDYNADSGQPSLYFKMRNVSLDEQIRNARKAIIQERVKEIQIPAFWGTRKNTWTTDEWRYMQNRADSIQPPRMKPE